MNARPASPLTLLVAIPLLAGSTSLRAQHAVEVSGRIQDETGAAITAAQIELAPVERRVVTGSDGRFRLAEVRTGRYELRLRRIGFHPLVLPLEVGASDTSLTITLVAIPRVLDSVRVRERGSQLRFTAIVLDDTGLPVPDAEFVAEGIDNKLRTDSDGRVVVPDARRGTLMVRIRRVGYEAFFGTFVMQGEREDTLLMKRLPQTLSPVEVLARSGFGRDTFAFIELHSRQAWRAFGAGTIGREELESLGSMNLCEALALTKTGAALRFTLGRSCSTSSCVLIDGLRAALRPISAFLASEVEAVEYFPRRSDWSGTLAARTRTTCRFASEGSVYVIWLRRER